MKILTFFLNFIFSTGLNLEINRFDASQFLSRNKRGLFGKSMERECIEEVCDHGGKY